MIEYKNFKDMKDKNPELAKRLLDTVDEGDWQDYQLVCDEDMCYYIIAIRNKEKEHPHNWTPLSIE